MSVADVRKPTKVKGKNARATAATMKAGFRKKGTRRFQETRIKCLPGFGQLAAREAGSRSAPFSFRFRRLNISGHARRESL